MSFLVPGPEVALAAVKEIYTAIDNVKVYREQCRDLADRCRTLAIALRDNVSSMEGSRARDAASQLELIIEGLGQQINEWAGYNFVKSLMYQGDIKKKIDDGYRKIDACFRNFNVVTSLEISRNQQELIAIRERDQMEILEQLRELFSNSQQLRALLRNPQETQAVMQTVQEELQDPLISSAPSEDLQKGLWEMHKASTLLPPLPDLTGQVVKIGERPRTIGGFNDIFQGEWLGEEKVALKYARAINFSPRAKQKFLDEVEIWRGLQHPNVSRFYGIVRFGEDIYSVSPWMDNGTAIEYVVAHPTVDRLKILIDVAFGMEYLHLKQVIHGDLRGANILIDSSGRACLSDFGVSKTLEKANDATLSTTTGMNITTTRWSAPELVHPDLINAERSVMTYATDVWSFGMTCLELMTGAIPYKHRERDTQVVLDLSRYTLPPRPGEPAISYGLDDRLWDIMKACWQPSSGDRWPMSRIREALKGQGSPPPIEVSSSVSSYSTAPSSLPRTPQRPSTLPPSSKSNMTPPVERIVGFEPESPVHEVKSNWTVPRATYTSRLSASPGKSTINLPPEVSPTTMTSSIGSQRRNSQGSTSQPRHSYDSARGALAIDPGDRRLASQTQLSPITAGQPMLDFTASKPSGVRSPRPATAESQTRTSPIAIPNKSPTLQAPPQSAQSFFGTTPSEGSSYPSERMHRAFSISGFSASSSSSQLQRACMDPNPYFRLSVNGTIEAGTLEGLISRLLADRRDPNYEETFLTTFRAFTSAQTLAEVFIRKFEEANSSAIPAENRAILRYNILRFMRNWFERPLIEQDAEFLQRVIAFGRSVSRDDQPPTLIAIANELAALADRKLRALDQHSPRLNRVDRSAPPTASELAIALTIFEGQKFSLILPDQCVAYVRRRTDLDAVPFADFSILDSARETNRCITEWVKKSVLDCDHIEDRITRMTFMCQAAAECRRLGNFSSMFALMAGLESPEIKHLSVTCQRLAKSEKASLQSMNRLMEWTASHAEYRKALSGSTTAIPYLEIHLRDFQNLFAKNPATVELEDHVAINFLRCTKLEQAITDVIGRYRPPDLQRVYKPPQVAYLESQLRKIAVDSDLVGFCQRRSSALHDDEKRRHVGRVDELSALGFRSRGRPTHG